MNKEEFNIFLGKAKNLCSKSEKCADDIYKKNRNWKLKSTDLEEIIKILKDEDFINHQRFARAFAHDKLKFNHWGKKKIEYALKMKTIEENFIQEAIDSLDDETYQNIINEEISKKHKSLKDKDKTTQKHKLIQFLVQKGFEYGKVFELVDNRLNS
jgi:regulatory protein